VLTAGAGDHAADPTAPSSPVLDVRYGKGSAAQSCTDCATDCPTDRLPDRLPDHRRRRVLWPRRTVHSYFSAFTVTAR
jgi:hypothetical protein